MNILLLNMGLVRGKKKGDVEEHNVFVDGHTDPMTCKELTGQFPDSKGRCPMFVKKRGSNSTVVNDQVDIVRTDDDDGYSED